MPKLVKPRGVLVAGNWKMNHGPAAARTFVAELAQGLAGGAAGGMPAQAPASLRAAILAPAVSLSPALQALKEQPSLEGWLEIGAQNAHHEASGAFTGELSGALLREIGIGLALVGHSERRQLFGETDESAGQRLASLLHQGFRVIFCVGETLGQRQAKATEKAVLGQLEWAHRVAQARREPWEASRLVIAYEPVWAIGTGLTATPGQAQEVHALIRDWLKGKGLGQTPVVYGGSVTPENFAGLLECPDVDGGLVGGASLKSASFLKLIETGAQAI
jgi:triosephosphate isomerase